MPKPANRFLRTRIAPTPSGYLHLGNVLSFAITAAIARKNATKILLRIDDLDQARADKRYIQDIFDTLNFLKIPWDEGPRDAIEFVDSYSQLHRIDSYREALKQLSDHGLVFACTCSRRQMQNEGQHNSPCNCYKKGIPLSTDNASWRLITANDKKLIVKNYNGQAISASLPVEMNNFIVKRKDGFPSYQLASMVDDLFYGVDLVVRGQDLWPSTLAQHELALALGKSNFGDITFYHHQLLTEATGKKLSKSAGSTSIRYLRENGKTPDDIYTLIAAMLGSNDTIICWEQLAGVVNAGF